MQLLEQLKLLDIAICVCDARLDFVYGRRSAEFRLDFLRTAFDHLRAAECDLFYFRHTYHVCQLYYGRD